MTERKDEAQDSGLNIVSQKIDDVKEYYIRKGERQEKFAARMGITFERDVMMAAELGKISIAGMKELRHQYGQQDHWDFNLKKVDDIVKGLRFFKKYKMKIRRKLLWRAKHLSRKQGDVLFN